MIADRLAGDLTESGIARTLTEVLPAGSTLVVASSMPIRDVEWFGSPDQQPIVHANRGRTGSMGPSPRRPVWPWPVANRPSCSSGTSPCSTTPRRFVSITRRAVDLTIVAVDNDGGAIFSFLPQATVLSSGRFEELFGTPHGTDLAALAAAHHLDYRRCTDLDELRTGLGAGSGGVRLLHLVTDRVRNVDDHRRVTDEIARSVENRSST
ncbi:MAG: hypothetical protein R2705_20375 [Ilumatobacteraceae bacterium]